MARHTAPRGFGLGVFFWCSERAGSAGAAMAWNGRGGREAARAWPTEVGRCGLEGSGAAISEGLGAGRGTGLGLFGLLDFELFVDLFVFRGEG